jgi:hypothetical protein
MLVTHASLRRDPGASAEGAHSLTANIFPDVGGEP